MHVIYRVQSSNEKFFKFQLERNHLTNAALLISDGAVDDYNTFMNPDVKVYFVKSAAVNLSSLESDLRLNSPTKESFVEISASEFYI